MISAVKPSGPAWVSCSSPARHRTSGAKGSPSQGAVIPSEQHGTVDKLEEHDLMEIGDTLYVTERSAWRDGSIAGGGFPSTAAWLPLATAA